MTGDPTNPEPDTNHSTLTLPDESEYASGHAAVFLSTEVVDHRTFDEMERVGQLPYRG